MQQPFLLFLVQIMELICGMPLSTIKMFPLVRPNHQRPLPLALRLAVVLSNKQLYRRMPPAK